MRFVQAGLGIILSMLATQAAADEPCLSPEARAFDFWVGAWDITNHQRNPAAPTDGALYPTGDAVMHVHPVAGGCAVVEHWRGTLGWGDVRGFSVRAFDPESGEWTLLLNWPDPKAPVAAFSVLKGRFEHGRGTFFAERTTPAGQAVHTRFTFSDIAPDRYRWDSARSIDGGLSWTTDWVMRGTRRPDGAETADLDAPAFQVPAEPLCTDPRARALDGLVGQWRGQTDGPMAALPVTLEVRSILGGCAQTEHWTVGDEAHFVVRAYDQTSDRWVAWRTMSNQPRLWSLQSEPGAGPVFLSQDGNERIRETFRQEGKKWRWLVKDAHGDEPFDTDLQAVLSPVK